MAAVKIVLTQGRVALVDESDAPAVLRHRWHAARQKNGLWYARCTIGGKRVAKGVPRLRKTTYLHVFIMRPSAGQVVDHKDGDGLNCRRKNMRNCTQGQNIAAMKVMATNKTGYRGVSYDGRENALANRWKAQIVHDSRARHLGRFATAAEAARAYDSAATELFGEFARLNFPNA